MTSLTGTEERSYYGAKYRINQSAAVLICSWMIVPFVANRVSAYIRFAIYIVWMATTDLKWLTEKWSKDMVFVLVFMATFVPYFITGDLRYGVHGPAMILVTFPQFFMGIFINHYYMYYKKDYSTLGKVALFSLLAYTFASLQTFVGLLSYPSASREMANPATEAASRIIYRNIGIGGYGFIYSLCFIFAVALYPVIRKATGKPVYGIISVISFAAMALALFRASYFIALAVGVLGLLAVVFVNSKTRFILFAVISAVLLVIVPSTFYANISIKLAELITWSSTLQIKFFDIADNILQGSLQGKTGHRFDLYVESLTAFINHPVFGSQGPFGNPDIVLGGHSGWLDTLALFGLFTGLPMLLAIYFNIQKHLRFFSSSRYSVYVMVSSFSFIILGLINPTITVYEIGFMFFFLMPAVPFLRFAFVPNGRIDINTEI